jgi:hypothetical protein
VERLEIRPVGAGVGNVANNGPQLTARVEQVSAPGGGVGGPVPPRSSVDQPALF